jgi:3-isopropylmalate/(R)-2-methylmalate dehydratase small subunit
MKPFEKLTSRIIPLAQNDVDTDQIIPARYLKVTNKDGLAEALFYSWRYLQSGAPNPEFVLNQPSSQGAHILLAGDNFGCGSSREHAPWALMGWGIQVVISTSFADIFRNNALKNGLLPLIVTPAELQHLFALTQQDPTLEATIDLAAQTLSMPDGTVVSFPIDPFSKTCLLQGLDQLGYLLSHEMQIMAYEQSH